MRPMNFPAKKDERRRNALALTASKDNKEAASIEAKNIEAKLVSNPRAIKSNKARKERIKAANKARGS